MLRQTNPAILQELLDSVPKTKTGAIDFTKAECLAEGGTHVLYRFQISPVVFKLMRQNPTREELDKSKKAILARKTSLTQGANPTSHVSTTAMLMDQGIAKTTIIKSEEGLQPKNPKKTETSNRPSTPFDSIKIGPKPPGYKD